ncbi:MAG: aldehyde dehydrogenase family protein [Candidatus Neomarinimicrobiota bacterium]
MTQSLHINKTYKLYIDGKFLRTESGRYIKWTDPKKNMAINFCRGSRKDFRNAVVTARSAFKAWSGRSAYNRGQIFYRIAEMLESRKEQFKSELILQGFTKKQSEKEVALSINRLVYYAGWADKYQQLFSRVNPVSSPYYNFSSPEPTGVVAVIAPDDSCLLGLLSVFVPAVVGGNTVVVLVSESFPLCGITFAEVLHSSDVPGGVINIMSGRRSELIEQFSSHMDVNAIIYCGIDSGHASMVEKNTALNVKRAVNYADENWINPDSQGPYHIMKSQEIKTTWHPIGN